MSQTKTPATAGVFVCEPKPVSDLPIRNHHDYRGINPALPTYFAAEQDHADAAGLIWHDETKPSLNRTNEDEYLPVITR